MTISNEKPGSDRPLWNSLEIAKLIATIATPVMVFVLSCLIWTGQRNVVQHWESDIKERDRLREFRISIYKDAAPLFNDILSYHLYVGRWKERSPADIIEKKRQLDSLMYSNVALLSREFFGLYWMFMREGFRTAGNHYGESRIRTQAQCRHLRSNDDPERWLSYFTNEDRRPSLCVAYANLLGRVSEELLFQSLKKSNPAGTERPPVCPPLFDVDKC